MASVFTVLMLYIYLFHYVHCEESPNIVMLVLDDGPSANLPGALYKIIVDGSQMTVTDLDVPNIMRPRAIDYETTAGHIYWTDIFTNQINRVDLDGRNDVTVVHLNSNSTPNGLTLDSNTRQIFYTDSGNGVIARIEMSTFVSTVIINEELDKPMGIVADTKTRKLYWVDLGIKEKIESIDYNGRYRRTILTLGIALPTRITIDAQAGMLYWAKGIGSIESIRINGMVRRNVLPLTLFRLIVGLSYFNGFLYYTTAQTKDVHAFPVDNGRAVSDIKFSQFSNPVGIHVFSTNSNSTVSCPNGHYGPYCVPCGRCLDRQKCEKTTGVCLGGCSPGYLPYKCRQACLPGTYGKDCGSTCGMCKTKSTCDAVTGDCSDGCLPGWRGNKCNTSCPVNTYGACVPCGLCAEGAPCDRVTGFCPSGCQHGWTGNKCYTACLPHTFGTGCQPCGHCAAGVSCDVKTGQCPSGCQDNWLGPKCNFKPDGNETSDEPSIASSHQGLSAGPIAVITAGVTLVIIAVVIAVAVLVVRRQKRTLASAGYKYVVKSNSSQYIQPVSEQPSEGVSADGYDDAYYASSEYDDGWYTRIQHH